MGDSTTNNGDDMPLKKGKANVSSNIKELHKGPQYAKTAAKFGKKTADKQAVAAAIHAAGKRGDPEIGHKAKKRARSQAIGKGLMGMM